MTADPKPSRGRAMPIAVAVVLVVAIGAAVAVGSGAVGGPPPSASPSGSVPGVIPADAAVVAEGRALPAQWAELVPAASGVVAQVAAEGATVKAGDVVLALDTTQADAEVAGAQAGVDGAAAGVARSEAGLLQAQASVAAAEAGVDQAAAGRRAAQAARDALPSAASTDQEHQLDAEVDRATAAVEQARAQRTSAKAGVTAAGAAVSAAKADLARAQAGLASAQAARGLLVLKAPFAGTVIAVSPRVGDRIGPNAVAVRLADVSAWRFETTDLSETTIARVRQGAAVSVTVDGLPDAVITGTVERVGGYGASSQGDIVFRVIVAPDGSMPEGLRWNMTVTLEIEGVAAG